MWNKLCLFGVGFVLFLIPGLMTHAGGAVGGLDPDCNTSELNNAPCNDVLAGCPTTLSRCHATSSRDKLCDQQGGTIKCNQFQLYPACLGWNQDKLDSAPCNEVVDPAP